MKWFRWIAGAVAIPAAVALMAADRHDARAQQPEKKLIRITSARGVHFVTLWGMGPFAEKYGLRTEMIAATTNADQQRSLQTGGAEVGTLGYQNPAIMAEQNVANIKVIAGLISAARI